jgi:N-acetylmuramic acid 6-phosphate etherase
LVRCIDYSGKALMQPEPNVGWAGRRLSEHLTSPVAEASAAAGAASINAQKQHVIAWGHATFNAQELKGAKSVFGKRTNMQTERPSPRFTDIDVWEPTDVLEAMIGGQFAAVAAVRSAFPEIERAALDVEDRLRSGGRLVYAGAGTSGRIAVQDGAELMPTFSWPRERLLLLIAGGDEALIRAVEGAEDEIGKAVAEVRSRGIGGNDVLIAVAASGTTPFTLSCLREAKSRGAFSVGISNNRDTPILGEADRGIALDTGAEPLAGSTRMNAGTAQRITLNLLSTLVMIRLGRVYRGMMVEVQSTNAKLEKRKRMMVAYLAGRSDDAAQEALEQAQGNAKIAILMLHGCSPDSARAELERAGGRLRQAIESVASHA